MECEYLYIESSSARSTPVSISLQESAPVFHRKSTSWSGRTEMSVLPTTQCHECFKSVQTPLENLGIQQGAKEFMQAPLPSFQGISLHQTIFPFVTKHSFQGTPLFGHDSSSFLSTHDGQFSIEESPESNTSMTVTPHGQTLFMNVSDSKKNAFLRGSPGPALIPELNIDDSQDLHYPCLFMRRTKTNPFREDDVVG
jgi:hypothetical protein